MSLTLYVNFAAEAGETNKKIRILNWWNFIAPEVELKLKNMGFEYEIIEYRSNEVALAKLLGETNEYDIAIVSNWALKILKAQNKIDLNSLGLTSKKRNYYDFIRDIDPDSACLPYLWATTTYAADVRKLKNRSLNFFKLVELKRQGFKIGIIDDPIEFSAMALLSYDPKCASHLKYNSFFDSLDDCALPPKDEIKKQIVQSDFRNSIKFFIGANTAIYGWVGEIGEVINDYEFFDFVQSDHPPIVGLDSVCILKRKAINNKTIEFVKELTNPKMTILNAEKMQYFVPYKDLNVNYQKKVKKVNLATLKILENSKPITLNPPSNKIQEKINQWWQKIRYDEK